MTVSPNQIIINIINIKISNDIKYFMVLRGIFEQKFDRLLVFYIRKKSNELISSFL